MSMLECRIRSGRVSTSGSAYGGSAKMKLNVEVVDLMYFRASAFMGCMMLDSPSCADVLRMKWWCSLFRSMEVMLWHPREASS